MDLAAPALPAPGVHCEAGSPYTQSTATSSFPQDPVTYDPCTAHSQLWTSERAEVMAGDALAWSRVSCLVIWPCPIALLSLWGHREAGIR